MSTTLRIPLLALFAAVWARPAPEPDLSPRVRIDPLNHLVVSHYIARPGWVVIVVDAPPTTAYNLGFSPTAGPQPDPPTGDNPPTRPAPPSEPIAFAAYEILSGRVELAKAVVEGAKAAAQFGRWMDDQGERFAGATDGANLLATRIEGHLGRGPTSDELAAIAALGRLASEGVEGPADYADRCDQIATGAGAVE